MRPLCSTTIEQNTTAPKHPRQPQAPNGRRKSTNLTRKVRNKTRLTQAQLAERLNVNLSTLRNWEQERNHPKGAALILLKLLDQYPELIDQVDLVLGREGLNGRRNS